MRLVRRLKASPAMVVACLALLVSLVEVGLWIEALIAFMRDNNIPPDALEVLDFYAARSPIFMAAIFDADAAKARGQEIGDGTSVHITIPTNNPWVPLRILGTGKTGAMIEPVEPGDDGDRQIAHRVAGEFDHRVFVRPLAKDMATLYAAADLVEFAVALASPRTALDAG